MAHPNEYYFLKRFVEQFPTLPEGRVLNIGSSVDHDGETVDYSLLFEGKPFVGIDLHSGEGVDLVCDMTGDCHELQNEKFATIICASVLEHSPKPWLIAANIEKHMLLDSLLYVTVPWVWPTHEYPKDYWRMSPDGISSLFSDRVLWKGIGHSVHGTWPGEFVNYKENHDNAVPWRIVADNRCYLAMQVTHMIGRFK
jgi:hypothetical protein